MPDSGNFWFSLVAASPNPETEEAANIALVVGNGQAFRLVYNDELPRLCGLANSADAAIYRTILRSLEDKVARGIDPNELQALLGPQLRIMKVRTLYREPTDDVLGRLKKQFLEKPRGHGTEAAARALVRQSTSVLASALRRATPSGVEIAVRVTPKKLYGRRLDSHVGFRVPPIARAVRFQEIDVLVDSVVVESETAGRPLTVAVGRVSQAFFAYNQLRDAIHRYANRDVRLIGVIHASSVDDPTTLQRREWVKHTWSPDSDVIDGNEVDVPSALRDRLAALRG